MKSYILVHVLTNNLEILNEQNLVIAELSDCQNSKYGTL